MKSNHSYRKNNIYPFLFTMVLTAAIGLQSWRTLFNNFAVEEIGVNGLWIGIIQSVRELPGLLSFLVIYLMLIIKERDLASWSIILLGLGNMATPFLKTPIGLALTTFIMSTGFHYFETCNQSLCLQYFEEKELPLVLARFKSISSLGNIFIGIFIWLISFLLNYKGIYILLGFLIIITGVRGFFFKKVKESKIKQKRKIIIKKDYWLFYTLNLIAGGRRQIFIVFALFLLVDKYSFSIKTITLLFVINNIVNYFLAPLIGKAINLWGERVILSIEYTSLIIIFLVYAFVDNPIIAATMYVLDHIFFNFSIAIKTFFKRTALKEDISSSMAISYSINHITAVFLPLIGGFLWLQNYRLPFIAGACLSAVSIIFVQFIPSKKIKS